MIAFLRWLRSLMFSAVNSIARLVALAVLIFVIIFVIALARGDGLPGTMLLTADLRQGMADSAAAPSFPLGARSLTLMDTIFALDDAGRDTRVKGLLLKMGGGLSLAQAEELSTAIARFRAHGKFVIAQTTGFSGPGLGDYAAATAANEIWVQPHGDFSVAGTGVGEVFLRGLFDKIHAIPQMAKRAEYKSAADTFTEKTMTDPDREQMTALMTSLYGSGVAQVAAARHLTEGQVTAAFEASPQFAEEAKARGLVDRIGYDDDALGAGLKRAGTGAKPVKLADYARTRQSAKSPNIAVVEASGEIRDGTAGNSVLGQAGGIASDDLSEAIRQATRDAGIKAIVLRVDSPGGSVSASDQILDAVKKAQKAGKPVVVSMGGMAASGGYYISASANSIVAEPATLTGSIGVLTGKVSFGGTADLIGVKMDQVSKGKNVMMDSPTEPFTPDQWTALNHEADVIYADFLQKVSAGRHLPLAQVSDVARGRVWSGADAASHGLVNTLGGFWTAADQAAALGKIAPGQAVYRIYPRPKGLVARLSGLIDGADAEAGVMGQVATLLRLPAVQTVVQAVGSAPQRGVELRAPALEGNFGN